jgi:hypothetical protein
MVLAEIERTLMRIKSVHDVEAATLPVTGLPNHLNHLSDGNANFAREGSQQSNASEMVLYIRSLAGYTSDIART